MVKDITDKEFQLIREYIKTNFGINLNESKKTLIHSRLRSTLTDLGFENYTQYYEYLLKDASGDAVVHFINKMTTNHTFFMRETSHFNYLRDTVMPYIAETYKSTRDLRLWCAACSTGEEAYTLQMIVNDCLKDKSPPWDQQILATDISSNVLEKAMAGIYTTEAVATLPDPWRKHYFKKYDDKHMIVIDEIKKNIIFRKFNLMDERYPQKKKMHVVFCRNVMIYFDNETRDGVVRKFYDLLEPGGYLFIGHSESLSYSNTKFKYVMPAVYRKE